MKQGDNWSAEFREKMNGYTLSPPDEVWEELEKELSSAKVVNIRFHRIGIAAAVVLLFLLSSVGVYFMMYSPEKGNVPVNLSEIKLPSGSQDISADVKNDYVAVSDKKHMKQSCVKGPVCQVDTLAVKDVDDNFRDTVQAPVKISDKVAHETGKDEKRKTDIPDNPWNRDMPISGKVYRNKNGGWALGLYAGNQMLTSESRQYGLGNLNRGNASLFSSLAQSDDSPGNSMTSEADKAYRDVILNNIGDKSNTDIVHRFPFTFGLTVRKDINDRFSVESGLTYTLLSSELTAGNTSYYVQEQKLHYLGIPLKANWNYVKKKYFTLYLSAGGMVETCVSSQLRTMYELTDRPSFSNDEELKVDRLQWSVSASAGAQYNITRHIGIYLEPGIIYYFNDGTQVSTIRKEKPFNVNLQMGLRLGF